MRALCLLLAGLLGLLVSACGDHKGKQDDITPVSKYKELLGGQWEVGTKEELLQGYEFGSDNTLKMTIKGMAGPVQGKFTWSGDKELEIEHQVGEEVKKQYAAAVKAYKEPTRKKLEEKNVDQRSALGMKMGLNAIPDELPARETLKIILGEKPFLVLIVTNNGVTKTFKRAE
jgi:hypothetical protein